MENHLEVQGQWPAWKELACSEPCAFLDRNALGVVVAVPVAGWGQQLEESSTGTWTWDEFRPKTEGTLLECSPRPWESQILAVAVMKQLERGLELVERC